MEQLHALDAKNDNIVSLDAISKEMKNVRLAFDILHNGKSVSIGPQFVQCHVVCDIKMEDFRQRAGLWQEAT